MSLSDGTSTASSSPVVSTLRTIEYQPGTRRDHACVDVEAHIVHPNRSELSVDLLEKDLSVRPLLKPGGPAVANLDRTYRRLVGPDGRPSGYVDSMARATTAWTTDAPPPKRPAPRSTRWSPHRARQARSSAGILGADGSAWAVPHQLRPLPRPGPGPGGRLGIGRRGQPSGVPPPGGWMISRRLGGGFNGSRNPCDVGRRPGLFRVRSVALQRPRSRTVSTARRAAARTGLDRSETAEHIWNTTGPHSTRQERQPTNVSAGQPPLDLARPTGLEHSGPARSASHVVSLQLCLHGVRGTRNLNLLSSRGPHQ